MAAGRSRGWVAARDCFVLPWAAWFAELPTITQHLTNTSRTTSVYGRPLLMAVAVVALLSLGTRRAGWLAVPLLWPTTQLHYAAISVPGLTPYLALLWCIPVPEVWLASTCAFAVHEFMTARRRRGQLGHARGRRGDGRRPAVSL